MVKILIVEDSDLQRKILIKFLNQLGYDQIIEANDYQSGLVQYIKESPHIIFMDVMLPGRSGIDLIDEIKRRNPTIKIIAQTSLSVDEFEDDLEGLDLPLAKNKLDENHPTYIAKPITINSLQCAINKVLREMII